MLIEGAYNWPYGYIGGTWDASCTLFSLSDTQTLVGDWSSNIEYFSGNAVLATDGNVYVTTTSSRGINPVGDETDTWTLATPYNLTGYSASFPVGPNGSPIFTLNSADAGGITLGGSEGTIVLQASPSQTTMISKAGQYHAYLQLTDSGSDIYFALGGTIAFTLP